MDKEILNVELIRLSDIPCYYIRPHHCNEDGSVIVYYHGWSSNKDRNLFLGKLLAFHGYRVIIPDAIYHGERNPIEFYNIEALGKYFWEVIFNSLDEYKTLIRGAEKQLNLDRNKLAVMGSSMGGFIASGVFADNSEIKCLINMNGACAWEEAEKVFRKIDKEGKGAASIEQKKRIKEYDPLSKKTKIYPRPILMLHGDEDTSVTIDIQRHFYKEIIKYYEGQEDKLKLIETPRLDHYKTIDMLKESIDWLDKFL